MLSIMVTRVCRASCKAFSEFFQAVISAKIWVYPAIRPRPSNRGSTDNSKCRFFSSTWMVWRRWYFLTRWHGQSLMGRSVPWTTSQHCFPIMSASVWFTSSVMARLHRRMRKSVSRIHKASLMALKVSRQILDVAWKVSSGRPSPESVAEPASGLLPRRLKDSEVNSEGMDCNIPWCYKFIHRRQHVMRK